jgi:hypothetical protein
MNSHKAPYWFFPSLVELARDRGPIGQVLGSLDWIVPEADRWAEQTYQAQRKPQQPRLRA